MESLGRAKCMQGVVDSHEETGKQLASKREGKFLKSLLSDGQGT